MVTLDISSSSKTSKIQPVFQDYLSVSHHYEKKNEYSYLCRYIYTYVTIYVTRKTQNQNDLVSSILQSVSVVQKDYCVVCPTSELPHLILCVRE